MPPKKEIITFLLLIFVILSIPIGTFLVTRPTSFLGQAKEEVSPENIKVSSVTDHSATISWITPKESFGFISFGETGKLGTTLFDDRDSDVRAKRQTHIVTLKNLSPQSLYYFKIGVPSSVFDDNGRPFSFTTGSIINSPPPLTKMLSGVVVSKEGVAVKEAIVYVEGDIAPVAVPVKSDGSWSMPVNSLRTKDLKNHIFIDETTLLEVSIETGDVKGVKIEVVAQDFEKELKLII